jgi:hypothetical protein
VSITPRANISRERTKAEGARSLTRCPHTPDPWPPAHLSLSRRAAKKIKATVWPKATPAFGSPDRLLRTAAGPPLRDNANAARIHVQGLNKAGFTCAEMVKAPERRSRPRAFVRFTDCPQTKYDVNMGPGGEGWGPAFRFLFVSLYKTRTRTRSAETADATYGRLPRSRAGPSHVSPWPRGHRMQVATASGTGLAFTDSQRLWELLWWGL